jgi:hypothetical protein
MRHFAAVLVTAGLLSGAPSWVERSNEHSKVLLNALAKISPEGASRTGVEGVDEEISDLSEAAVDRSMKIMRDAETELRRRLAQEKDPKVRQDLQILIEAAQDGIRDAELDRKLMLPYASVAQLTFGGIRALLDDQVKPERRGAALVRLRRYAGVENGYQPVATVLQRRLAERMKDPDLLGPFRTRVEQDLARSGFFLDGLAQLFQKYKIDGYGDALATLRKQADAYHEFVQKDLMPRTRTDFRLPPEMYARRLEAVGVDIPKEKLAEMAHQAFNSLQKEMESIAAALTKEKGWQSAGYRDVIRQLKKDQIVGDAILPHYQERIRQIEEIVRREDLVTLPDRPARMRIASAAESAAQPAPNMQPPRLVGNTGESGVFVLPLNIPGKSGQMEAYDDFTFAAASWTLTAHEARPGHEMQFAKMIETGVSQARAVFAFNSTNVEGWGLYAEAITLPFMPLEGQIISLQHRMMRAARAFLDPELQMGKVSLEEAMRVLTDDVMLSKAMARQEVERYTFRSPGQATSYFYGFTRLQGLRRDVEQRLGSRFNARTFHDFVLAQGLLPPDLLRKAVMEDFVPARR